MTNDQEKLVIGRVSSPHGIKGWLKILSYTDPIENIFSYKSIFLKKSNNFLPFEIEDYSISGKIIRMKLKGIDDRNHSEEIADCEILINRNDLPEISSDSYYWADLIGFQIKKESGEVHGILDSFLETGSNDVMVVIGMKNNRNLIPFINGEVIKSVDLESKIIIVDWDEIE
tara:strand:- start:165 stop:680 length:516 start_codon:yes stop_codon:yes gene_type:complete